MSNSQQSTAVEAPRVLIVEDEPRMRQMLLAAVPSMGFECSGTRSAEEALQILKEQEYQMVILDLNLPGMDGLDFFEHLRKDWPKTQVVILTGFGDLDVAKKAIRLNVADFLTKPCPLGDLERALDRARRKWVQAIQTDDSVIRPMPDLSHIPDDDDAPARRPAATSSDQDAASTTLEDIERSHILEALERNDGNRSGTAKELGISVRKLYYRIAQYQDDGFM
jgi:DNA-binding NtrC family response regulator